MLPPNPSAEGCPGDMALLGVQRTGTSSPEQDHMWTPDLPLMRTRKASQVSLGQRVVRKIQLRESSLEKPPSQFHHGLPLPWQLNSHTMDPSGESMYGRLEVDWVREPMEPQRGKVQKVKLPR
ncbi:hypothetical protein J4Q44_G00333790 [Coregonus suidteri]|uniref:Uncharacterized protein n=1 Tax=Coregonus suidteri TaxID=861788 RepID=A0AAN8KVM6_9TELE